MGMYVALDGVALVPPHPSALPTPSPQWQGCRGSLTLDKVEEDYIFKRS